MKYDELAFFNQQLANMLRNGVPLEGALRHLCLAMQGGRWRHELLALQSDLSEGIPINDALAKRDLPSLYVRMIQLGAKTDQLAAVLDLLAGYYQRVHSLSNRLKGLLVYPVIVLTLALFLSLFLAFVLSSIRYDLSVSESIEMARPAWQFGVYAAGLWAPPLFIAVVLLLIVSIAMVPPLKRRLFWRIKVFQEAKLAEVANAIALLVRSGCPLQQAVAFMAELESPGPAGKELTRWHGLLASGHTQLTAIMGSSKIFPSLFVWLVGHSGENVAEGFHRASQIYYDRANYRMDLILYAILPASVLLLTGMIAGQALPLFQFLAHVMRLMGAAS